MKQQKNKTIISMLILISLLFSIFGNVRPVTSAASKIKISVKNCNTGIVSVKKGTSYNLGVKAGRAKVTYKTSKKKIAIISKKGIVKAKKKGVATITISAKIGKKTSTKKISVKVVSKNEFKRVKSLRAPIKKMQIYVGDKIEANVIINPNQASNNNLLFSVDKKSVVSISGNGQIIAKKAGKAKVNIRSCDNKKAKASINVTVNRSTDIMPSPTSGTDPIVEEHNKDSDNDGYPDYTEINYMGTDPYKITQPEDILVKGVVTAEGVQEIELDNPSVDKAILNKYCFEKENVVSLVLPIEFANVEKGKLLAIDPCQVYPYGASVKVEKIKKISNSYVAVSGKKPDAGQLLKFINIEFKEQGIKQKKESLKKNNELREEEYNYRNIPFPDEFNINVEYPKHDDSDSDSSFQLFGTIHCEGFSGRCIAHFEQRSFLMSTVFIPVIDDLILNGKGYYDIGVKLSISKEDEIDVPIPLGIPLIKFAFGLEYSLSASASLSFASDFNLNVNYHSSDEQNSDFDFNIINKIPSPKLSGNVEGNIGAFAKIGVMILDCDIVTAGLEAGLETHITAIDRPGLLCVDLGLSIGLDGFIKTDIPLDWIGLGTEAYWHIGDRVELHAHFENGIRTPMDECTWGKTPPDATASPSATTPPQSTDTPEKTPPSYPAPGAYDKNKNLLYTWDELLRAGALREVRCYLDFGSDRSGELFDIYGIWPGGDGQIDNANDYKEVLVTSGDGDVDIYDERGLVRYTYFEQKYSKCEEIIIPEEVSVIGGGAFSYFVNVRRFTIPSSVIAIQEDAFYGSRDDFDGNWNYIGHYDLNGQTDYTERRIKQLKVPDSVRYIERNAFLSVGTVYYKGISPGAPWGAEKVA